MVSAKAASRSTRIRPRNDAPQATRDRMSRQRSRDTTPEVCLRRQLHTMGHRFRVAYPVPGLPRRSIDIAFTRRKLAVFIDGCFWHSCPEHATRPKSDDAWWNAKLQRNVERDRETDQILMEHGWSVLRIWEHVPTEEAACLVAQRLNSPPTT